MTDDTKTSSQSPESESENKNSSSKQGAQDFGERVGSSSLDDHTVDELQEMAKKQGLTGTSNMRKDELIKALQKEDSSK